MSKFHIYIYIYLFIHFSCLAQETKITFCDILSKEIIENVHIVSDNNVYISNNEGSVFLSKRNNNLFKASHLSYNDNYFFLKDIQDTIFLKPKNIMLNEVVINSNKIKTEKIFPKRDINNYFTKNWGNSPPIDKKLNVAFFFPNENKVNNHLIKKIFVATCDYQIFDLNNNKSKKMRGMKYSPFKINLYTVDPTYFIPKDKIFENDFIVQLKKNQKYAELIIDNNFILPEGGVFIVISNIDDEELKKRGYFGNPGIVTIGVSKNNKNFPFKKNNAINEGWMLDKYLFDRKSTYYIGVEIELHD